MTVSSAKSDPGATPLPAASASSAVFATEMRLPSGMRERAVTIPLGSHRLRGNLIAADGGSVGVLFLHGWSGTRGGPHNLLTAFARGLAEAGVPSLRFDFRGRGESSGELGDATLDTMGEDALAAAQFLLREGGVQRLVLVGLCSGGNVAIGIHDRLPATTGLFLLSVYPFSDGDSFGRDARRSAHYLAVYWRKLWLPGTWRRLLRGGVDVRGVLGVVFGQFKARDAAKADPSAHAATATSIPAGAMPAPAPAAGAMPPASGGPPPVPASHRTSPLRHLLARPVPVQMVYGDTDPDFAASLAYYQSFVDACDFPVTFTCIPGANHNFYSQAWKSDLLALLLSFTEDRIR